MSAVLSTPKTTSGGEIITNLINASDGAGLHFDGTSGSITLPSPPTDLGTAFSFEFIIQADEWKTSGGQHFLCDFREATGDNDRVIFGSLGSPGITGELGLYSRAGGSGTWNAFTGNPKVLDDLKVHHLTLTVDGTSAILYDNGNQIATAALGVAPIINNATAAAIASAYDGGAHFLNGTIYRARLWNKTLSQTDVTSVYESASIDFADQWGSQTIVIPGDFTGNLDGWDASNTWNSQTNPSNNMVLAANATAQRCRTSTQLTLGKRYRCTYTATSTAGEPAFAYHNSGTEYALAATVGSSTITNGTANSFEFVMPAAISTKYFYILATTASDGVTLDDVSVVEVGAVADFDLAYANPTQSIIIQNRSGSGDATAAGGVSQISPIEQLNSRAARIGTSAATPADGELVVSGKVGIGMVPARTLDMQAASNLALRFYVGATLKAGVEAVTVAGGMISTSAVNDLAIRSQSNMLFSTGGNIERLRIDSAGRLLLNTSTEGEATADNLTIADTGHCGITLRSGTGSVGTIFFSDGTSGVDEYRGYVQYDHSANFLKWATDGVERMRIDSAGNTICGVLTATENCNFKFQGGSNNDKGPNVELNTSDGTLLRLIREGRRAGGASNDVLVQTGLATALKLGTNNTTHLSISSAGLASFSAGIAFSGQTDATGTGITSGASTLNHYETGTWTPALKFGDNQVGISETTDGHYVRIGNLVYINLTVALTAKGSSTGSATVSGLPFAAADNLTGTIVESAFNSAYSNCWLAGSAVDSVAFFASGSTIAIRNILGTVYTHANFTDTSSFRIAGTYLVA